MSDTSNKNKTALIVGGSNGIGLAIANELAKTDRITIIDRTLPDMHIDGDVDYIQFDLLSSDYSIFDRFTDVDKLVITAGIGRLSLFNNLSEDEIIRTITINSTAPIRILHHFKERLYGKEDFFCAVMVSISGFMSSPFFSVYGATKAALKIFIESVNVELKKAGTTNRILNVSPGSINGTRFSAGTNNLDFTLPLAREIIFHMKQKNDIFIPQYEEVFKKVLERYNADFRAEGEHSYEYKLKSGRVIK